MYEIRRVGYSSILFIIITAAFMGGISLFQTASQMQLLVPDFTLLGAGFIQIMTKEMVPVLVGLMIAARIGSSISAEISSMKVSEQVDAMTLFGMDPVDHIVAPILAATALSIPLLAIMGLFSSIAAGTVTGYFYFGIHPETFLNFRYTHTHNFVMFVMKSLSFGVVIPVVASLQGLRSGSRGAYSVGTASIRGVVYSSVAVILLDLLWGSVEHFIWG